MTASAAEERSVTWLIAGGMISLLAVIALTRWLAKLTSFPDQTLPVELVGGLAGFLIAIGLLILLFRRLGIVDRTQPLGMPPGSIRAIMALILILLFVLLVVFIYFDIARPPGTIVRGVTAEQFAKIPFDQIESSSLDPQSGLYTVGKYPPPRSADSVDIGKQVITTVSTLVVSISAFYFGAQSVEMGRRPALIQPGPTAPRGAGPTPAGSATRSRCQEGRGSRRL